ncbi:hypothetical protein LJR175_008398 [Variovorax sp. LjRoot175]|uniref:hypothetical protein n=1 Tax=Variovorax sp. LjRoot175 TaxID=3342276 RepID=UPI003ECEEEC2
MKAQDIVATATHFYVANLSHGIKEHRYIAFWRPNHAGYAYPLSWAGRYDRATVLSHLDHYNSGDNIAVPCKIVEQLAIAPAPGAIDGDAGPVVPSNAECWDVLIAYKVADTKYEPKPKYRRVPRTVRARGAEPSNSPTFTKPD